MITGAIALYEEALREQAPALVLRTADGRALPLQMSRFCGPPDTADEELLRHCRGPVLDVGCGPGRLTVALAELGIPALGVDISRTAVAQVHQAGAPALHRSVFDRLPGHGRWATVLLADGNIGIGGLPARLLERCAQLLAPDGRILIEAEPGNVDEQLTAWLEHPDGRRGPVFPWARMGTAALLRAAADAGLHVIGQWRHEDRAFVCAAIQRRPLPEGGGLPATHEPRPFGTKHQSPPEEADACAAAGEVPSRPPGACWPPGLTA
ncbi:class I SAM-dependent methyltransferase [Trebonia kvetii]|uniref:Class I SAM-dependent methyltransferase n=1 Tax=Trebonia kvetii TaxID=2480626 RepID=A0A6P2C697_9ACTN|nr:class I SAM-dependent methyltransferase [Trebonia kvetii]TVZ06517.1 class I SAM-dependent methyltransferase [Trebonia kvetii]